MVYPHKGHPSAAGQALDRESSPVTDRRSTTVPRNQPNDMLPVMSEPQVCEMSCCCHLSLKLLYCFRSSKPVQPVPSRLRLLHLFLHLFQREN